MLHNVISLLGVSILAQDGNIRHVRDVLFEDQSWALRCFVVETGSWLSGGEVSSLRPSSFSEWNREVMERKIIMPIQLQEENDGKMLAVHVTGKLVKSDYEKFVPEFERLVQQHGKLRVLFDMTGFHGWEGGALWDEIKFDIKHFADIERIAAVGDRKWQHGMAAFFTPFTKATTRYFDHADAAEARKWLDGAS